MRRIDISIFSLPRVSGTESCKFPFRADERMNMSRSCGHGIRETIVGAAWMALSTNEIRNYTKIDSPPFQTSVQDMCIDWTDHHNLETKTLPKTSPKKSELESILTESDKNKRLTPLTLSSFLVHIFPSSAPIVGASLILKSAAMSGSPSFSTTYKTKVSSFHQIRHIADRLRSFYFKKMVKGKARRVLKLSSAPP